MSDLISVIVPIYNVSMYLEQCLLSICQQSYTNLDIILIDDGSTDESSSICDRFANQDKRIQVVHQKNKGLSEARNKGLDIAKGEYIAFIDSDDFIEKDMLQILFRAIQDSNAEISMCSFNIVNKNNDLIRTYSPICNEIITGVDVLRKLILSDFWYYSVVWNKLYTKKIFQTVRFLPNKTNEDDYIFYDIFINVNRVYCLEKPLYFYRNHSNSIMGGPKSIKHLDGIEAAYFAFRKCEKSNKELMEYMYFFAKHQIRNISLVTTNNSKDKERVKEIKKMFLYMYIKTPNKKSILNTFQAIMPKFYYKVRKWIKE